VDFGVWGKCCLDLRNSIPAKLFIVEHMKELQVDENTRSEFLLLLTDIEKIESDHKEYLRNNFNIFVAAGLLNQEIRHSKILAFFLDPSQSHGLDDYLLRKIINSASLNDRTSYDGKPDSLKVAIGSFNDASVRTEVAYSGDRLDILIESKENNMVVIIENKVLSSFSKKGQLEAYRTKINNDAKYNNYDKLFIYLSLGEDPDDKLWWAPLSYKSISEWLTEAIKQDLSNIHDDAFVFVRHYIDLLKRYVMEDNEELAEVCRKIYLKHKNVLDLIMRNIPSTVNDAFDLFKNKYEKQIIPHSSQRNKFSFLSNRLSGIVPQICEKDWWKQRRPLIFWFDFKEEKGAIVAVTLYLEVGPIGGHNEFRKELVQEIRHSLKQGKNKIISDSYSRVWKAGFVFGREDDSNNPEILFAKMNELFNSFILKNNDGHSIEDDLCKFLEKTKWPNS
jgi:hypothetical protein